MVNIFDLQLFAGAGGAGGAGSGAGATGGTINADGAAAPGQQTQQAVSPVAGANGETANNGESFDDLIKGRYKAEYDQRVQATIQDRLKGSKEREAKAAPMLQAIAEQYGVDANDIGAITDAFLNDPKRYEKEALEQGISPETAARLARMKRDDAAKLAAEQQQRQLEAEQKKQAEIDRHFNQLQQQAEQLKQIYPGFNLDNELKNQTFLRLTNPANGIDVRTAYEVVHRDELRGAEMQYATQRTANRVSAAIQAGQRRPVENGVNRASVAVNMANDPSKMNKQQLRSISDRVNHGERITWDQLRGGK